jgi:hypothetical protein
MFDHLISSNKIAIPSIINFQIEMQFFVVGGITGFCFKPIFLIASYLQTLKIVDTIIFF